MTTITALPTPPTRTDAGTFRDRADAFLGALPQFGAEANAVASEVNAMASSAATSAGTATTQAGLASNSAALSAASALAAQASAGASAWVSGTTYAAGYVVWSSITYLLYRRIVAGAGTTDPSADATNWALASSGAPQMVTVTTSTVTAQGNGHYVLTYAGVVTVTLPATPAAGTLVWITVANGRRDNVVARNGSPIQAIGQDMTLDDAFATVALRYLNGTDGWRILA